ncbi:MAG: hypothetical protein ETSY2_04780 [Candidatus Entotheonella gemina]|uniref:ATP-binding protein n=2 Tax=Candidatus Entotheonella TaxID=93171 RepID=W4MF30_9BACT|nr:MAG: hypothetical protein ETSY2_04780 [Candidatus Entotheonella gemina]
MQKSTFEVRRALERLREGLYDPLAVRLLTANRDELDAQVHADLKRLETGEPVHLCVSGPYGQGKSHTLTYLREYALAQGYVVSAINLDPREAPLHQFRQVYRALLDNMTFPVGVEPTSFADAWQSWAKTRLAASETDSEDDRQASEVLAACLPEAMPHPFKATMAGFALTTLHVPVGMRKLRQYRDYRPTAFPVTLLRMLMGETVPVANLRPALKYRQVSFYRQASLTLRGETPFFLMIETLAQLLQQMGYKGWVLLFDEAEAIIQVRSTLRARAYRNLNDLLSPTLTPSAIYPVFAFTPDFFQKIREEDYDLPYFDEDYASAWRDLSIYPLRSLSRAAWQDLSETLIGLHAEAYQWTADREHLRTLLDDRLRSLPLQDTRVTLKGLIDELDQVQQEALFAS